MNNNKETKTQLPSQTSPSPSLFTQPIKSQPIQNPIESSIPVTSLNDPMILIFDTNEEVIQLPEDDIEINLNKISTEGNKNEIEKKEEINEKEILNESNNKTKEENKVEESENIKKEKKEEKVSNPVESVNNETEKDTKQQQQQQKVEAVKEEVVEKGKEIEVKKEVEEKEDKKNLNKKEIKNKKMEIEDDKGEEDNDKDGGDDDEEEEEEAEETEEATMKAMESKPNLLLHLIPPSTASFNLPEDCLVKEELNTSSTFTPNIIHNNEDVSVKNEDTNNTNSNDQVNSDNSANTSIKQLKINKSDMESDSSEVFKHPTPQTRKRSHRSTTNDDDADYKSSRRKRSHRSAFTAVNGDDSTIETPRTSKRIRHAVRYDEDDDEDDDLEDDLKPQRRITRNHNTTNLKMEEFLEYEKSDDDLVGILSGGGGGGGSSSGGVMTRSRNRNTSNSSRNRKKEDISNNNSNNSESSEPRRVTRSVTKQEQANNKEKEKMSFDDFLKSIKEYPDLDEFMEFNDEEKTDEYFDVIKQPICFSEIQGNIDNGSLTSIQKLYDLLLLMCKNSMTYFKRNNPKYLSSRKFKSYIATHDFDDDHYDDKDSDDESVQSSKRRKTSSNSSRKTKKQKKNKDDE